MTATTQLNQQDIREVTVNPAIEDPFLFPCPSCHQTIDAMTADWCRCLVKRASVVCSECRVCLCKAEPHVLRGFWERAPAAVVARNTAERNLRAFRTAAEGSTIDVLIVDDDDEIRTVAAYMVQQMGYSVLTANGASEALEMMQTVKPSLVLTDALMPKTDGRQLCRYIKAGFDGVRVVIMTSLYTSPRYKYEAMKTFAADDYVIKPIDFERLSDVVGRLVPRHAQAVA